MSAQVKKSISFFFLFLFLFPLAEKEVHDIWHSADEHCTASQLHFHKLEHHCAICDLTVTNSDKPTGLGVQFILSAQLFSFLQLIQSVYTPEAFQNLPSRAPPVV